MVRLGDGTEVSHARMQAALDELWPYTGEMFAIDAVEQPLIDAGIAADCARCRGRGATPWPPCVRKRRCRCRRGEWMHGSGDRGGKQGVHTEHLGRLLAEMQFLQRAYPGAAW